jgi:hypothetical protein
MPAALPVLPAVAATNRTTTAITLPAIISIFERTPSGMVIGK